MYDHIDNEMLIALVEERPMLWDKTLPVYKDRAATLKAWEEVFQSLRSDYNELNEEEKENYGIIVMRRWKHMRDAFVKSEKMLIQNEASGIRSSRKRRYLFHQEMQFLKKNYLHLDISNFIMPDELSEEEELLENRAEIKIETTDLKKTLPCNSQRCRNFKKIRPSDRQASEELEKTKIVKPDVQMSFFQSMLPHIEHFNQSEWLQFQMEVLNVIANIRRTNSDP